MLAGLGVFGASLFFGDSMITPAISVLSAVEGVKVAAPSLSRRFSRSLLNLKRAVEEEAALARA